MKQRSWKVAYTVRTDRKDIFSFAHGEQHHIGTIISGTGSSSGTEIRFSRDRRVAAEMRHSAGIDLRLAFARL